jgi:hypothetical protein
MREMDYRKVTHIRIRDYGIHIVVNTIGLMHSKIFRDCYEPLSLEDSDEDGNRPFFQTCIQAWERGYFVSLTPPLLTQQECIYLKPRMTVDEMILLARTNHKSIVAHTKAWYREKQWYE